MIAFIFSSLADRPLALLCVQRIEALGAQAIIVLDASEASPDYPSEIVSNFPRRGRLFGAACAAGIAQTIVEHSADHETIAKIDADTWLTMEGMQWLAGPSKRARGFKVANHQWSGIWSAPREIMLRAAERITRASQCTGCPEAHLFKSYFHRHCGTDRAPDDVCQVWRSGRPIHENTWIATLPSGLSPSERLAEGTELLLTQGRDHGGYRP